MIETCNAVISKAQIRNDDHGCLTAWISLDYGDGGQGFGGYALYLPKNFKHHVNQKNVMGHFIWRMMEVAEVSEWGELVGKTIRVKHEWSKVHAVGHIIKDVWFEPSKEFEEMRNE